MGEEIFGLLLKFISIMAGFGKTSGFDSPTCQSTKVKK